MLLNDMFMLNQNQRSRLRNSATHAALLHPPSRTCSVRRGLGGGPIDAQLRCSRCDSALTSHAAQLQQQRPSAKDQRRQVPSSI